MPTPTRRRAFTLIELIIAVVILAVLATIAVPSYLGVIHRATLAREATNLNALAGDALSIARSQGQSVPTAADFVTAAGEMPALTSTATTPYVLTAAGSAFTLLASKIGSTNPSTTYGQVSLDTTDAATHVGLAMASQTGGCVMGLVSASRTQVWTYPASLGANCSGAQALAGSAQSTPAFSAGAPGAPTGVAAHLVSLGQIAVSWSAPTTGDTPTSYLVTSADSTNSSSAALTCSTSTTSCTVTGLAAGDTFTFTVTATNAIGVSPESAPSAPVLNAVVPDAPTAVVAVNAAASGQATVSWTAPASDGASPVTGYTATASGGATCATSTTSCSISGLTLGASYTFTVTATNVVGTGAASIASAPLTITGPPAVPTGLSTSGPNSSLTATFYWSAPASDGGAAITGYAIRYSSSSSSGPWTQITPNTGSTATSYSFTLPSSSTFYWQVAAINSRGVGAYSSADTVTWTITGSYTYSYQVQTGTTQVQTGTTTQAYTCVVDNVGGYLIYGTCYETVPVYTTEPVYTTYYGTGYYYGWRG